jgi:hypothetical protein
MVAGKCGRQSEHGRNDGTQLQRPGDGESDLSNRQRHAAGGDSEVLLFSIADCINSATEQVQGMYAFEVAEWSRKLDYALLQLSRRAAHDDGEVGDASEAA